jgi:hypothetical protein
MNDTLIHFIINFRNQLAIRFSNRLFLVLFQVNIIEIEIKVLINWRNNKIYLIFLREFLKSLENFMNYVIFCLSFKLRLSKLELTHNLNICLSTFLMEITFLFKLFGFKIILSLRNISFWDQIIYSILKYDG